MFIEYEIEFFKPHNHLDTIIYAADEAFARWNPAQSGTTPGGSPSTSAKLEWGTGVDLGRFKLADNEDGLFEVVASVATPSG